MKTMPDEQPELRRPIVIMGCTSIVGIVMIVNGYETKVESTASQVYASTYILGGTLLLSMNFLMEAIFSAAKYIVDSLRLEMGPVLSEVHRAVKGIEGMPAPAATNQRVRVENAPPAEPAAARPQAPYYYSTDGSQQGPVTVTDLKSLRADGLITDNTPVLRAGETQWSTYRDYSELKG